MAMSYINIGLQEYQIWAINDNQLQYDNHICTLAINFSFNQPECITPHYKLNIRYSATERLWLLRHFLANYFIELSSYLTKIIQFRKV